ncbi:dienelactone hydrolase family protein [Microtetraspora fusca]|uniref:Dienelactone hydrolase family protein n=1 Tax=Microtetraspora fusca TaxID=1997 RepID=A0ABW6VEP1_MICFU|nr:dienelactone hydrolase family protein [Microtetraspora fusca]
MTEIVLFHSAQGLRPGVSAAADILRSAGHTVRTPDYYDGEIFDDIESGLRKRDALGFAEVERRVREIGADIREPAVFAGFSLGAYAAQLLAATHPAARGAVLLHGGVTADEVISGPWPSTVPVQVHYMERDPWIDATEIAELGRAVTAAGARFEAHVYPGETHLFTDPDLPGYDPDAAALVWQRVIDFFKPL